MRPTHRAALGLALLVLLVAAGADAHSFLDRADPRPGSTVKSPPTEVRLRFTERLEPAFSTVHVTDEQGKRVDRGEAVVEPGAPRQLRVPLGPLVPDHPVTSLVEGWRGPIWHWALAARADRLARVKVVDPSYRNWPALEYAVLNNIVPDFPLCNKSFNLSYSGSDL